MPIHHSADHRIYAEQLAQGCLMLESRLCWKVECRGEDGRETLVLSKSVVTRMIYLPIQDEYGEIIIVEEEMTIALARCTICEGRQRVLPCDVHVRKRYAVQAIELFVAVYNEGHKSLRTVVHTTVLGRTPAHATLHAWTEGLGAYVLGRRNGHIYGATFANFLSVLQRHDSRVTEVMQLEHCVNPLRYRSKPRWERLVAVGKAIKVMRVVSSPDLPAAAAIHRPLFHESMVACRRLMLTLALTCPLGFQTGFSCTLIEHRTCIESAESPLPNQYPNQRSNDSCKTRTRSPPGDSNI